MDPERLQRRCPRLGGDVPFAYCRTSGEDHSPCLKVMDCWWERFDVVAYLKTRLSVEAFDGLAARRPPTDKVASLVELIRRAQARAAKD
jgi:hypothetical protein